MTTYTVKGNQVLRGPDPVGSYERENDGIRTRSVKVTAGSTTIEMQRRSSGRFEILRSGVPVGYEERGLRIVYEGQVYEPESRRALVHFVNGSENRLVIMSMGMEAVVVERSQDSISATSDLNPDVALVCLGMLAPYSRPAVAQAVTTYSPYSRRRAYYRLSPGLRAASILVSIFGLMLLGGLLNLYLPIPYYVSVIGGFLLAFVVPAIIGVLGRKRAMRRAEEVAMEGDGGGNKAR